MLRLLSDADVPGQLIRGLRRRQPQIDLVRAQDVGLRTALDPAILEWAAAERRIVISRDVGTMVAHAYDRVRAALPMPGVFILRSGLTIGQLIDEILLIDFCSEPWEWQDQVVWLPL
jgi:predicted nuclease of predicted toxin-antitoxin system